VKKPSEDLEEEELLYLLELYLNVVEEITHQRHQLSLLVKLPEQEINSNIIMIKLNNTIFYFVK
jgi:hypothetical protein